MKHKLNKSPEQVYESIKEHVTYARKFTDDVEWSCEDGTRTDMDYMCKTVELAIKCGAKTINIPDTVGYTVPVEFTKIINKEETKKRMKEVLADIQSGKFTKQWMDECKNGQKNFLKTREKLAEHPVEKVGAELRALMPWIAKKKLIDSDKN